MGFTPLNARDPDLDQRLLRVSSRDVVLVPCLRAAIDRLKPAVTTCKTNARQLWEACPVCTNTLPNWPKAPGT